MKRRLVTPLVVALIVTALFTSSANADGGYVVRTGDTLASIAYTYGVSIQELAWANGIGWNDWVYVGQRLVIPGQSRGGTSTVSGGTYVVRAGDTLAKIAYRHGVSASSLIAANNIANANLVYTGQKLVIPGGGTTTATAGNATVSTAPVAASPAPAAVVANTGSSGERWIDINLTNQTLTAYNGNTPVLHATVSTGRWQTPTVVGTFKVYKKYDSQRMIGPGYDLPGVPHVMYFYSGYALHGTYWHNKFGTQQSHGCVNLTLPDAEWLYNWASVGTKVVTHY